MCALPPPALTRAVTSQVGRTQYGNRKDAFRCPHSHARKHARPHPSSSSKLQAIVNAATVEPVEQVVRDSPPGLVHQAMMLTRGAGLGWEQ